MACRSAWIDPGQVLLQCCRNLGLMRHVQSAVDAFQQRTAGRAVKRTEAWAAGLPQQWGIAMRAPVHQCFVVHRAPRD